MKEKVEVVLNKIRPSLVADGGNVELVDVEDGIVKVKLVGACAGCPMSQMGHREAPEKGDSRGAGSRFRLIRVRVIEYDLGSPVLSDFPREALWMYISGVFMILTSPGKSRVE
jgi:hypothetical protein